MDNIIVEKIRSEEYENAMRLILDYAKNQSYAFHSIAQVDEAIFKNPYYSDDHTFVGKDSDGKLVSVICGCTGNDIPYGGERGYFTILVSLPEYENASICKIMFVALEKSFSDEGMRYSAVTFFNPMRMPWVMNGTPGYEHNNVPGIAIDLQLYKWMTEQGYRTGAVECAMYKDLADFTIPESICSLEKKAEFDGFRYARYNGKNHKRLKEMLDALDNPDWVTRINDAADKDMLLPVMLSGDTVVGFAGPVYPEPTGRGYFAGIGIHPDYQHHGLGKILFYHLCEEEKRAGAKYMSLFTGEGNPARNIYKQAGFSEVRRFGVMLKDLQ